MQEEMVFHPNLLEKAYLFVKMTGPAMVRPASCDFWKAPLASRATPRRRCFVTRQVNVHGGGTRDEALRTSAWVACSRLSDNRDDA